jgi:hypothetical protein
LRLSPWRPEGRPRTPSTPHIESCRLSRLDGERWALEIRAPGAARVEVMGDMTGWMPVALAAVSADRFRTALALRPGPHTVSVRIDEGPWMAPPGAPRAPDSVDGSSGVLLAR